MVARHVAVAVLAPVVAIALATCHHAAAEPTAARHDGMPLDAVAYDGPEWLNGCLRAYRVHDRQTGGSWWLLSMWGGEYVTLPISGGES